MSKKKVTFQQWECEVEKLQYSNGRIALELIDAQDGNPVATASVNLPNNGIIDIEHTYIKTWSENEGILESLEEAGIVQRTDISVSVNIFGSKAILVKVLI